MSQSYSVHHKSHVDLSGIKPGPLWQQAKDYCLTVVVILQMSIELNWNESNSHFMIPKQLQSRSR